MTEAQTQREQRFARALDRELAPVWHDRFARLIYRHLPTEDGVFALDVHSGGGRSTYELLERLGPSSRVLGLEADDTLRGMAKARMEVAWKDRVYFRAGDLTDIADIAADTYDLLVANLVLSDVNDPRQVLSEFKRVVKPGGRIIATLPTAETWAEVEDLFQAVLSDNGRSDAARRLRRLRRLRKSGPDLAQLAASIGVPADHIIVEQERFNLLFKSGREFLFSPMVEHGPLRAWKAIVANPEQQQALFWQLKEAIDAYYSTSVFAVTVVAGVLVMAVPDGAAANQGAELTRRYWTQHPELDRLFTQAERGGIADEDEDEDDFDLDIDDGDDDDDDDYDTHEQPRPSHEPASASSSSMAMSAEDAAIFAQLDNSPAQGEDAELDELLDQVLEFANAPDARTVPSYELEPEELVEIVPADIKGKPGDTLSRIQALLPPPPSAAPPKRRGPPPPPPRKKKT